MGGAWTWGGARPGVFVSCFRADLGSRHHEQRVRGSHVPHITEQWVQGSHVPRPRAQPPVTSVHSGVVPLLQALSPESTVTLGFALGVVRSVGLDRRVMAHICH